MYWKRLTLIILILLLAGCKDKSWNNPHSYHSNENIFYSSFSEPPKTLDPAKSYSTDEAVFVAQIYEPPLQYNYLKRPYTLEPLTATQMPVVRYWDKHFKPLPNDAADDLVAYSTYDIHIKPGIYYQPHPAFAVDTENKYRYHQLTIDDLDNINSIADFKFTGTRELTAADYVYQIKRLAHPQINSPILGVMEKHIVGIQNYARQLRQHYELGVAEKGAHYFLDLRRYDFDGVKILNRYAYRITLHGKYPQFMYWLAMPFFAPIPWEADYFYSQPEMDEKNLDLDWYPVGTGAYLLAENNPNRRMVLARNPNFHPEFYPTHGSRDDAAKGYLLNAGKRLPFIDKFVFTLEKEAIPRWNKFLQGYYDQSGVGADSFDQAIQVDNHGNLHLTTALANKSIQLQTTVDPGLFYLGFNMLDDVVGGYSERAQKLRQAITIAMNYEEFISIFLNGRGLPAQGPIPPGIFGYLSGPQGIDPYVYDWVNHMPQRKSITYARRLLAEAGYPNGRDVKTGKPLILNLDVVVVSASDSKAQYDWLRKEFAALHIELNVQSTQYNRFQEKVRTGNSQLFFWGWQADYPDPENFLFLLYGPNGKVKYGGENASNYANADYDKLFEKMRNMSNNSERQAIINQMLAIVWKDSPWVWGFYPKDLLLTQPWVQPAKLNAIANNVLKYKQINPELRMKLQAQWNRPILWPLAILFVAFLLLLVPVIISYWLKIRTPKSR